MNLFTLVSYRNILITTAKAAAAAILFFLFSTIGPFQGKTFFFSVFHGLLSGPQL